MEKKKIKLLMLGLVSAGKHTILYKLRQKDNDEPIPTIGFNMETLEYQDNIYAVWHRNIGGYGNTGCEVFKRGGTKLEIFLNQHTQRK